MKRVSILMLLIMAFVSFATVNSFADSSPPWIEISIENDYEFPGNIDLIETNFTGVAGTIEGRIAVYDCDLKCWPGINESNYYNSNNIARVNYVYDDALYRTIDSEALNTKNPYEISTSTSNQYQLSINMDKDDEVLSLFYNSKGERFSARNEVT